MLFINNLNSKIFAENNLLSNNTDFSLKDSEKNQINYRSSYLIGAGDVLFIKFQGLGIYSNSYKVNDDGYLELLPEINKFYIEGKTIKEAKLSLENEYAKFIFEPDINIIIEKSRPIHIYISGEVKSPGLYTFNDNTIIERKLRPTDKTDFTNLDDFETSNYQNSLPRLFNLMQAANGITNNADLQNIKIIRNNSMSQGGGKIKANIDLLKMLTSGDQTGNILLHDGDSIEIPKSKKILKEQILTINNTNLNPKFINVYITGNVPRQGQVTLEKGSSLLQAIASSGGKKQLTGKVEFLRFRRNGSTQKHVFNYSQTAEINSYKNPILIDGDVINVRKTLFGSATSLLTEVGNPVINAYGLYKIFD